MRRAILNRLRLLKEAILNPTLESKKFAGRSHIVGITDRSVHIVEFFKENWIGGKSIKKFFSVTLILAMIVLLLLALLPKRFYQARKQQRKEEQQQ